MKRLVILITLLFVAAVSMAMTIEPSSIIVTINGKHYHKHTIEKGQTLYAIAKAYGVSEREIMDCNVGLTAETLKADEYILVPRNTKQGNKDNKVVVAPKTLDKKKFIAHSVVKGDTLYSIARKYKISVSQIEKDNPEIDIDNLAIGDVVFIRRAERGYATSDDIEREIAARAERKSAAVGKEGDHRVMAGETVYSISRASGISEEEFMAINGLSNYSDLKVGMLVHTKLPKELPLVEVDKQEGDNEGRGARRNGRSTTDKELPAEAPQDDSFVEGVAQGDITTNLLFSPVAQYQVLKVALMLPFHMNDKVNPYFVDFYRGVLLAMEDLKTEGYDINLSVFDTQGSGERVAELINAEDGVRDAQLVIGPVYEHELAGVVEFAQERMVPVVSPLADINAIQSPVLFQMQAEGDHKNEKLEGIFDGSREVVMIYTSNIDGDFNREMTALAANATVTKLNYKFDRGSFFYRRNSDGSYGEEIDIVEFMSSRGKKAYVVLAKNETDVDRILTTLASTKSSIVARSISYGDYLVVGNRKWKQSNTIEKQSFFRNNTLFVVPYYANRSNENLRIFDSRYVKAYDALPTMYSYRGYDAAIIFCRKMFEGIDSSFLEQTITPLATPYTFAYEEGLYVNNYWIREQYNSNFTISVE